MRNVSLKLALAGALSLGGMQAMALAPSDIDSSVVKLYVGGATATDGLFENMHKIAVGGVCQPGTLDIYYYKSSSGSIQNRAMFCRAGFTQAPNITSGVTKIAVFKESQGGSANGVVQVARGTPLQFIDFFSGSSNVATVCGTAVPVGAVLGFAGFNTRDCGASTGVASTVVRTPAVGTPDGINIIAPNVGVSDIDPSSFVGLGGVTGADAAAITRARAAVGVTFGPIVSTPLALALQKAQGLVPGGATAVDDSSINQMAGLSSPVLRGIFTGNVLDAGQVYVNGVQLSTLGGADTNFYLCRRGDTSGTMSSYKIHYLGQGCSKNGASIGAFATPDVGSCTTSGCAWNSGTYGSSFVFAGAGSGDVRSCMDYQSSQGRFAIGVASTESKPNNTNSRWRYIKVDGQEPTLKAVMEGRYDFFTENTLNDKNNLTGGTSNVWEFLVANLGNKISLAKVNESWRNAASIARADGTPASDDGIADTGILDVPNPPGNQPTFPVTANQVRSNAVNGQARTYPGSSVNNCNMTFMRTP